MKRKIVRKIESEQLEVKSRADGAWYNASVEVLDDTVRVRFEGFEGEDEIWDVNYLRKHAGNIGNVIRLTSPQLQDADCASVVEDIVVCARHVRDTDNSGEDGVLEEIKYFDAMVTKVFRIAHTVKSGEDICNCGFEAYWITGPDKKKPGSGGRHDSYALLDCADICTLNPGDVELHPVMKKIRQLIDSRIRERPSKQPVKELLKVGKSQTKRSRTKMTGERRKRSPIPSQQTGVDSDRTLPDSTLRRESRSRKEREIRAPEVSQQSLGRDTARRQVVEAETSNSGRPVETVASEEDLSSPTLLSKVAKKRARLDGRKQKSEQPISRKKEKKSAARRSSKADSAKLPAQRMRGSVLTPPAWFKPAAGGS